MRVNLRIFFVATIIVLASCQINADNTDGKWTNTHGRAGQHAHVSEIIEQYLLDTQALESFLEKHLEMNEKHKLHSVNKLFASHLASNVPKMDHLMSLPADASNQHRFQGSRTALSKVGKTRLRYNKLLTLTPYGLQPSQVLSFGTQLVQWENKAKVVERKRINIGRHVYTVVKLESNENPSCSVENITRRSLNTKFIHVC